MGVNWGVERMTRSATQAVEEATQAFREERQVHQFIDDMADGTAQKQEEKKKRQEEKKGKDTTEQPPDPATQEALDKIEKGEGGDITVLGVISKKLGRSIVIVDENGKTVNIIGDASDKKAIVIKHTPGGEGHWEPGKGDKAVEVSGEKNCLYDAIMAQVDGAKLGLKSGQDLRQEVLQTFQDNPDMARELFKAADTLP